MSQMYFKLENADQFVKNLKAHLSPEKLDELNEVAGESALRILNDTKVNCPYVTGFLRRSYRVFFEKMKDALFSCGVLTDCEYAPPVEFGTANRRAKPHLFPAYERERPVFLANLKEKFGMILK